MALCLNNVMCIIGKGRYLRKAMPTSGQWLTQDNAHYVSNQYRMGQTSSRKQIQIQCDVGEKRPDTVDTLALDDFQGTVALQDSGTQTNNSNDDELLNYFQSNSAKLMQELNDIQERMRSSYEAKVEILKREFENKFSADTKSMKANYECEIAKLKKRLSNVRHANEMRLYEMEQHCRKQIEAMERNASVELNELCADLAGKKRLIVELSRLK